MKQIIRKALNFFFPYTTPLWLSIAQNSFYGFCLGLCRLSLWVSGLQAAQGGQFGLSPVDFTRYFLTVFVVRQITVVWVIWDFEREVVEGKLSSKLLQPLESGMASRSHPCF